MNVVVFCGAGFSASLGLPTMANFNAAIERSRTLTDDQKADYFEIVRRCSSTGLVAGVTSRNLEDLVSILEVLKITNPELPLGVKGRLKPDDALSLVRICIVHACHPGTHGFSNNCAALITDLAQRSESVAIITTNYDLNIEIGAAWHGVRLTPAGFPQTQWRSQASQVHSLFDAPPVSGLVVRKTPVALCKLHGSVNWYLFGDKVVVDDTLRFQERPHPIREPALSGPGDNHGERVLVAPSFFKTFTDPALASQWSTAANAIRAAHVIVVIGYSFPASDRMMRYFFASALEQNTSITKIVFIDPNCGRIRASNHDFFASPSVGPLVTFLPVPWHEIRGEEMTSIIFGNFSVSMGERIVRQIDERSRGQEAVRRALDVT